MVYPERQLAKWTAIRYTANHLFDYVDLGENCAVVEVAIPEKWIGKTVVDVDIRNKYNINIMALKNSEKIIMNIGPDTVFDSKFNLLVLGNVNDIQKCFHL